MHPSYKTSADLDLAAGFSHHTIVSRRALVVSGSPLPQIYNAAVDYTDGNSGVVLYFVIVSSLVALLQLLSCALASLLFSAAYTSPTGRVMVVVV